MCLIIAKKPEGILPDDKTLDNVFQINSDGFGIAGVVGNRIVTRRTMGDTKEIIPMIRRMEAIATGPIVMHWRFCTNGPVNLAMTHPFQVATKERNGLDAVVAHNGVIDIRHEKTESDTAAFLRTTLQPLVRHGVGLLHAQPVLNMAAQAIGDGSKLAILTGDGRLSLVNEDAGFWDQDCWFSNGYSLGDYGRWYDNDADQYSGWYGTGGKYSREDHSATGSSFCALPAQGTSNTTVIGQQQQLPLITHMSGNTNATPLALPGSVEAPLATIPNVPMSERDDDEQAEQDEERKIIALRERLDDAGVTLSNLAGMTYSDCVSLAYEDPDTCAELLYEAATSGARRFA